MSDLPELIVYDLSLDDATVADLEQAGAVAATSMAYVVGSIDGFSGQASEFGYRRWTGLAAVGQGVPAYVLTTAIFERLRLSGEGGYDNRLLSAMRSQFRGHPMGLLAPDPT